MSMPLCAALASSGKTRPYAQPKRSFVGVRENNVKCRPNRDPIWTRSSAKDLPLMILTAYRHAYIYPWKVRTIDRDWRRDAPSLCWLSDTQTMFVLSYDGPSLRDTKPVTRWHSGRYIFEAGDPCQNMHWALLTLIYSRYGTTNGYAGDL